MSTQTLKVVGSLCFLFKLVMISPEHAAPNLNGFRPSVRDSVPFGLMWFLSPRQAIKGQL